MTELFSNISDEVKRIAEFTWNVASAQSNPVIASKFLDGATNYLATVYNEEEMNFIRFYFNMKMETNKDE